MITRSQSMKNTIDFDEASMAWMANKKRIGQSYIYICRFSCKNGKPCQKRVYSTTHCTTHAKFT
jgi:hypothetical protein